MESFVHLHTHSHYSLLDGASRIEDLIKKANQDGQPAIGLTDHGNMYATLEFYTAAKKAGIKPIIGLEAYMSKESRHDRPKKRVTKVEESDIGAGEKAWYHLTLLVENNAGYKNLMKLASDAFLEGYYYKPRVDWELLEKYKEGIIATSGCLGGLVNQALLADDVKLARELALRFRDIFSKDNFFIEIQDHGIKEQKKTNPLLIEIARDLGLGLVATNDSHYTEKSDAAFHDALLCIQTGSVLSDSNRFKFQGTEHYLKTSAEMRQLFNDYPDSCNNTLLIAERSHVEIELGNPVLPKFDVPKEFVGANEKESADNYLKHLTYEGAKKRYGINLPAHVTERIEYELNVISSMGFSQYFLVVWDLIRFAKSNNIRVGPGRGSAAGCVVAYCLDIVQLDPISHGLIFERFLNPGRKQMPDIDMDFDERYRADVIKYVSEKYGSDKVAQIITFSTIKARAAVRDAARVMGLSYATGDKIAKAMPPLIMGRATPLSACFEKTEEYLDSYKSAQDLREMYESDPEVRQVVDLAKEIEGLVRQDGIHAAAVVISDEPLVNYLPVQRKPDPGAPIDEAPIVTQYEMHAVEELGLLKMDFLGLRTLSVIETALDLIEMTTGKRPDIDAQGFDDPKTYEMLRQGDSIGVFQLESGPMRTLMRQLAPNSFKDIAALIALYRPGPMADNMHKDYADRKNGRQKVSCLHPDMEDILSESYGLMIYQEHMMQIAQKFAGYSLEEADNLRKACGKKIRSLIQKERQQFIEGCVKNGYGQDIGNKLFDKIEPFADYAFNKSHSYGYAYTTYQTAYLKANYPAEFMSALLSSVKDDKDQTGLYLSDCRSHGIVVKLPDINLSSSDFTPRVTKDGLQILYGLSAIRNVGEAICERILSERNARGPFVDFVDFLKRVDMTVLNKRALESLIKAGAFDSLGHKRKGLLLSMEILVDQVTEWRKDQMAGVMTLFDTQESKNGGIKFAAIADIEFEKPDLLRFEKEMLGQYVSDHPLLGYESQLKALSGITIEEAVVDIKNSFENGLTSTFENQEFSLTGIVTSLKKRTTKKGDQMAVFVLEDMESAIEVLVFPKTLRDCEESLTNDSIVTVKGRFDSREGNPVFIARSVSSVDLNSLSQVSTTTVKLKLTSIAPDALSKLKDLLKEFPGNVPVEIYTPDSSFKLPQDYFVDASSSLAAELRVLLGNDAILSC
jgi:DNA polymerase-3 subunit alpha